jgi:4-amino-4-deoxy-L-arabinose transferase-like glycosyltransferase
MVMLALKDVARRLTAAREVCDALAAGWAIAIVHAFLFARPFVGRMITLSGGDDWLIYESRARDIGINSIWMLDGLPLGQGNPFYQMPFYPYFVAATHWLFGDDLFGVFLIQRLLAGATVIALWRVTAALFGERIGCAGLLAAFVIVYEKIAPWNGLLLTESLFVPLVCFWALLLVKVARRTPPSLAAAAGAGAIGGLATLTRSSLMLGWPFALALVAFSLGRTKRMVRIVAVIAAAMLAVTSLATIRNWVVARQFVLVSTYGPLNLFLNNEPPKSMVTPPEHKAAYERLGLDPFAQLVVEYARQSPRVFFDAWRKRALYALGWSATLVPPRTWSLFYMLAWQAALVGVVIMLARPSIVPELPADRPLSLIPLVLAVTHWAVLITMDAGDRQLLTIYALLAPYIAIVVFLVYQGLSRGARWVRQK